MTVATSDHDLDRLPHSCRTRPRRIRILCLSDSDTRMKWTMAVAHVVRDAEAQRDARVDVDVVSIEDGAVPSDRQADELGVVGARRTVAVDGYADLLDEGFDVIVCNTVGSRLHRLTESIRGQVDRGRRPIVVTGYAGVVYEKHVEGALWRASSDIVCCNSQSDLAAFRRLYSRLGLDEDVLVSTGLAVAGTASCPTVPAVRAPRTLTFAVQPDVPRDRERRRYMLERLVDYAQAHPDRSVVVKLRSRPDEATTHRERHHYELICDRDIDDRPANLTFEYGLMADVLARTDLLVTVSSTAALEAIAAGIPAAILSDLGVREELGNHFFAESGLLRSFDDLIDDDVPTVDADWMHEHGFGVEDSMGNLVDRLECLLASPTPEVPPAFYGPRRTPYVAAQFDTPVVHAAEARPGAYRARRLLLRVFDGPVRSASRRCRRWLST